MPGFAVSEAFERAAARALPMPEDLDSAQQRLYLALRAIYRDYAAGVTSRAQAAQEKAQALRAYERDPVRAFLGAVKNTETARRNYHLAAAAGASAEELLALAKKIIRNMYNGSYFHKAQMVGQLADTLKPDAVIQFCHWGCKQSSGGSVLLKEEMQKKGIPMLILDGDGIDKRNSHDGQIKTRLEAFLEMLDTEKEEEIL